MSLYELPTDNAQKAMAEVSLLTELQAMISDNASVEFISIWAANKKTQAKADFKDAIGYDFEKLGT